MSSPDALYEKIRWLTGRVDGVRAAQARLYAAQSRDAGAREVVAGAPLRTLRRAVYRSLLQAERALDESRGPSPFVEGWVGASRILLRSGEMTLRVDLKADACLAELSDKAAGRNLVDTRVKRSGPSGSASWVDHLLPAAADVRAFAVGKWRKPARRRWQGRLEKTGRQVRAVLTRRASNIALEKSVTLPRSGRTLEFTHRLRNLSGKPLSFCYGTEFNWNLKDAHVNRVGETPGLTRFSLVDPAARLELSWAFDRLTRLWYFPREVALRDLPRGQERTYEGVSVTPAWNVSLPARGRWETRWTLTLGEPDADA